MSAMILFAGWANTGWAVIAKRSRVDSDPTWDEVGGAPIPLDAAMDEARAGRWIVAQRHAEMVSYLVCRPARRRAA
jgi:hypothetical protein